MADSAPNLALAFNLTPERAVEYFQAKGVRITSSWRDMEPGAHAGAFTVAGVAKGEVLQDIRSALDDALASGKTYDQFLKELKPALKAKGWWGIAHDPETGEVIQGRAMTPHRLRTVYQTNLQSAYMAGRYKAQLENADRRPYWQYVAILDSRTRPRHRSLNGRIFRYDDPAWGALYPPNGYNCRCRVKALSLDEFNAEGGALSKGEGQMETLDVDLGKRGGKSLGTVPVTGYRDPGTGKMFLPDPGFDSNPGAGYGRDIALARRVQELPSREIRTQVWQALNNSPARLASYQGWMNRVLDTAQPGNSAQVVGFVGDEIADFMRTQLPDESPIRIVAINEKRLVHADSVKHQEAGIALSREQYMALQRMSDAWIDPVTGNYELTLAGAPTRDTAGGLGNAVYLRLMTPLGSYWADAAFGSRLHELQREKDLDRVAVLARQYAEQALQPVINDGRATAIDVSTERPGNGRMHLLIVVTAASGERLTFQHPVKVI